MTDAYIIDAARTPRGIGKAGRGALAHLHSGRLLAKVLEAIRDRNDLNTDDVDDLVVGCSSQVGNQGILCGPYGGLGRWLEHQKQRCDAGSFLRLGHHLG